MGATAVASRELIHGREGIETRSGVFIPLYENHLGGIKKIPQNLDGFFREMMMYKEIHEETGQQLVNSGGETGRPPFVMDIKFFSDDVVSQLAQQETKIILGDTDVPFAKVTDLSGLGQLISGIFGAGALASGVLDKKYERRSFFRKIGIGAAVWGASGLATISNLGATFTLDQENAVRRIATRVSGLLSHTHPENAKVFFRNVLAAEKMLLAANHLTPRNGQKPRIGFNFGSEHSGIEDFLQAGPDVTRAIITAFPKSYLQATVDLNGSLDNLCSLRMVTLPKDFKPATREPDNRIIDNKIYDVELKNQLSEKLK